MCTTELIVMRAVLSARTCMCVRLLQTRDQVKPSIVYLKYGWEQGMEATIVAHDTRKQEDPLE